MSTPDEYQEDNASPSASTGTTATPATFLLTWNPEHYQDGGNAGVRVGQIERWSCNSTKPVAGDRVYLIRLGVDPRGIVARGTVTEGSFKAEDWRDATKTRSYIHFQAEETRPDCASGLVPMVLLEQLAKGEFKWSAQSSGISIPPELAASLDKVWETGHGVHSLAQCANWYQAQPGWENDSWRTQYYARIETIKEITSGQHTLDDATLDWLWREGANGVCTISPGHLSNAVYKNNIELLRELGKQILQNPGPETYQQVFARWEKAKTDGMFPKSYQAVIHRVFATAAPALYTTVVNITACRALLGRFARDFELTTTESRDWLELNHQLKLAMQQAGIPDSHPIDNNILIWMLYAAFFNTKTEESDSDDNLSTATAPTENAESAMTSPIPLNQILYGPPGTGKTYHTINKALEILEPELLNRTGVTRAELKEAFERYVDLGHIAFVTFHQSFSYEDFVEGLRAITRKDGSLEYRVVPGVFARLCEQARQWTDEPENPFDMAIQELTRHSEESEGNWLPMQTVNGSRFQARYSPEKGTFSINQQNRKNNRTYDSANLKYVRSLYVTGKSTGYSTSYVRGILDYLKSDCGLPEYDISLEQKLDKPVVLLIDEINRGNISRIFGELITLIEPSKRSGAPEELSTTLPYSKKPFSVPDNLFIIGTMNTADRSLAGLDIALRRRFVFEEMAPRPDLLKGIEIDGLSIGALLTVMNQRIEVLLDRDHCLGHAYFMPLKDDPRLDKLAFIFKNQILPLLQEYFFEDWERINWVLNGQQTDDATLRFINQPAGQQQLTNLFGSKLATQLQDRRWLINEAAFGNIDSYHQILKGNE